MASSLYRLLGTELGEGIHECEVSAHLGRDFIDATAVVTIDSSTITVQFQKRAHNPHLLEAGSIGSEPAFPGSVADLQLIFG